MCGIPSCPGAFKGSCIGALGGDSAKPGVSKSQMGYDVSQACPRPDDPLGQSGSAVFICQETHLQLSPASLLPAEVCLQVIGPVPLDGVAAVGPCLWLCMHES